MLSAFGHSWSSAFILPSAALGVPNLKDPFAEALVPDVSGALSWLARIALDWLARIALDWRARVALNWLARVAVGWRASVPLDWRAWIDDFDWCARVAWVGINNLLWGIARVAWVCVNNLHRFCIFFFKIFYLYLKLVRFYTVWINGFKKSKKPAQSNVLIITRRGFFSNHNFNFIFQMFGVLGFWGDRKSVV